MRVEIIEPASIDSPAANTVSRDAEATMAAASPEGRAPYQDTFWRMLTVMLRRERAGSPPDVAATIERTLTVARSRAVYLTGKNARRLALISRLPIPLRGAARRRIFGLPAPSSLASQPARTGAHVGLATRCGRGVEIGVEGQPPTAA